ncbi:hypothetical protein [Roseimicrobium sp. ORNL1]|nr:hypothetical protein [Roseimicrobium sp. ORNL1]
MPTIARANPVHTTHVSVKPGVDGMPGGGAASMGARKASMQTA